MPQDKQFYKTAGYTTYKYIGLAYDGAVVKAKFRHRQEMKAGQFFFVEMLNMEKELIQKRARRYATYKVCEECLGIIEECLGIIGNY